MTYADMLQVNQNIEAAGAMVLVALVILALIAIADRALES